MLVIRSSRMFEVTFLASVCISTSVPCYAQQRFVPPAEVVEIPVRPLPFILQGFLRRPEGTGRSPAVLLLPACGEYARSLDENWGTRISSWGYVTLTIDGFGPRAIKQCGKAVADYPDLTFDAYRALSFLSQKRFVDSKRVAIVGFGAGARQTLSAVERGKIEQAFERKFRAAAAFYPRCGSFKGVMTVPTLVLVGERDDLAPACRKMVAGEDDAGISRQKGAGAPVRLIVYPDADHMFDVPSRETPPRNRRQHWEFNKSAADQSSGALRDFLNRQLESSGNK